MQNTATATMPQVILQQDSVPAFTVLKKLKPVQLQDLCKLEQWDTTALVSHKVKTEARHCPFLASAYTKLAQITWSDHQLLGHCSRQFPFQTFNPGARSSKRCPQGLLWSSAAVVNTPATMKCRFRKLLIKLIFLLGRRRRMSISIWDHTVLFSPHSSYGRT